MDNYFKFTKDESAWTDTTIIFDISKQDNKTQIRMTHVDLVPEYECYEIFLVGELLRRRLIAVRNKSRSYYRLKQTDFDNDFTYSKIVLVDLIPGLNPTIVVHPNPVNEDVFFINLEGYNKEVDVVLSVYDVMGKPMTSQIINTGATGFVKLEMQKSQKTPGIYFISAVSGWKKIITKVIIN
ncbi:MAG: T9SS type A sorting domain-containing protein [Chryseolinea sp.]